MITEEALNCDDMATDTSISLYSKTKLEEIHEFYLGGHCQIQFNGKPGNINMLDHVIVWHKCHQFWVWLWTAPLKELVKWKHNNVSRLMFSNKISHITALTNNFVGGVHLHVFLILVGVHIIFKQDPYSCSCVKPIKNMLNKNYSGQQKVHSLPYREYFVR